MKLLKLLLAATLVLGVSATTLSASSVKGQKLFIKKFKKPCGMNGAKFAAKHSQDEWQNIMDNGNFKKEFVKICPNVKEEDIKDSWVEHIFEFSYEYANDSGNVPSC
ncbi:cytochrome C [Arcobacter sp. YIC-464]|uniref:cytochrome C n=1 Tax=Arcobacter sp. YIC-464 TaxID=3376631 RepID=UPI003C144966